MSAARFRRLFRPGNPHAPKRYKLSRALCVNATQLADCLTYQNELETAMGLAELARYLRMTYYTALQAWEEKQLPEPFGYLRARPRWRKVDADTWLDTQLDGARPPLDPDPTPARRSSRTPARSHA